MTAVHAPATTDQATTRPADALRRVVRIDAALAAASGLAMLLAVLVPVVEPLGYDPLWFGVLLVMNLELAVITPPVGLNLFAMKSVAPEIPLSEIIKGVIPYIILEFALLMVMVGVPEIATWLPSVIVG